MTDTITRDAEATLALHGIATELLDQLANISIQLEETPGLADRFRLAYAGLLERQYKELRRDLEHRTGTTFDRLVGEETA